MTRSRWESVQDLFFGALDVEEGERVRWVHDRAPDKDVAAQVMDLLEAHGRPGPFDELVRRQDQEDKASVPPAAAVGDRIGRWEVTGHLGNGGMGVVLAVQRSDGQYDQRGALKILPRSALQRGDEARFLAERQILAELTHPNIAQLLDGGEAPDGRPFFVMERVDGLPLHRYCEVEQLDLRSRLRLFVTICSAVDYAHQHLVVHRDIKPTNVLVNHEGVPKLLDFGIARMLVGGSSPMTDDGGHFLTPDFASPEQRRGAPVSTASDVYQLGVVLYLIVTGRHPFPPPEPEASSPSPPTAATADRSRPPPRDGLDGDLYAVVTKAMSDGPADRYPTAGALGDEVKRRLDHRAVMARQHEPLYLARKMVRRHAVAATALVFSVVAVLAFAFGQQRQARETRLEAERSREVTDFLVDVLGDADPYRMPGEEATVRQALERGAARVRRELADQPANQVVLIDAIGQVYLGLDDRETGLAFLGEALDVGQRAGVLTGMDVGRALARTALVHAELGDFAAVDTLIPEALTHLRSEGPHDLEALAAGLNDVGYAYQVRGDIDAAEPLLEESLRLKVELSGELASVAPTLTNLGHIRNSRGDLDSAAVLLRRSVDARRSGDPDAPRLASSLDGLAGVLRRKGELEDAEAALAEALTIRRRLAPEGHPSVAATLYLQGMVRRDRGDLAGAEALIREALAIRRANLGDDHFVVGFVENGLALTLSELGRAEEAEESFRRSISSYRTRFGPDHLNTAVVEINLARHLASLGVFKDVVTYLDHAMPIVLASQEADARVAGDLVTLGIALCQTGSPVRADSTLMQAVAILAPTSGEPTPDAFLRALNARGSCLSSQGRVDEARQVLQASLEAMAGRSDDDPYRSYAEAVLATLGNGGR